MKRKTIISLILVVLIISITILLPNTVQETYAASTTLADKVISLSKGSTWSSGASGVYNSGSGEYRYIGANVNNYVSFNNDMYRIIGVFDGAVHGNIGKNLVKLIRSRPIGSYAWGIYNSSNTSGTYSSYKNDWTGATTGVKANLNVLLNEYFYNKTSTSSTYGACSNWTYYSTNTNYRTNDCANIVNYGIDSTYQNYIEDATWWLWGYSGNGLSKQNFASCEKGSYSGCTSANSGAYSTSTQAKIGLMYVSDYMYASGYCSNSDTTTGSSYSYGNQNWLYQGYEWTITPKSNNSNNAFNVSRYGSVSYSDTAFDAFAVRPTFYLKSDVYITGGDGSFSNPYTIGYGDSSSSTDNCTVTDYITIGTSATNKCEAPTHEKGEEEVRVYAGSSLVSKDGGYVLSGNIYGYTVEGGSLSGSATNVFSCCATSSTAVCAEEDLFYVTSLSDPYLKGYSIEITGTSCDE